ncbi:MAG: hypothetical protein MJE68_08215 [Proteobacteria bacterium]|nr:hypothetical protein [Pseudomonadota bacterium]
MFHGTCLALNFILNYLPGILPALSAPDLRSSVSNGSLVYPEQPITITCVTRNTQILAWESEDYIGGMSQIVFASSSQPDSTDTGRNGAIAILISVNNDNGELVITSELLINITTRSKTSSVTCRNVDNGQTDSIVFHRTNESATELMYPNKTEICPKDRINITCMARNTSIIQWSSRSLSNGQIHCIRSDPVRRNDTMGNTVVDIFTEYSAADVNGNTVLTCSLSFVASELPINEQLSLVCLNVDIGVREVATISLQTAGMYSMCGSVQCT